MIKALHYSCFWHFFTRCITAVLSDIGFVRFLLSSTSGPQASSNFLKSHSRLSPQRGILHAIDDGYSFVNSAKTTLPSHILQTTKYYFITVGNLLQPQVRDERPPIIAVFLYNNPLASSMDSKNTSASLVKKRAKRAKPLPNAILQVVS